MSATFKCALGTLLFYLFGSPVVAEEPLFVTQAQAAKEKVERQQAQLAELRRGIARRIAVADAELSPVLAATEIESLAALRPLVQEIRELGRELVAQRETLRRAYSGLRKELQAAPPFFAEAGRACRQYAAEEPYAELKADYIVLAEIWERLATSVAEQDLSVEAEARELGELLRYIDRTNLYLERLDAQLAALPTFGGEAREYIQTLRKYIERFESLRGSLWQSHERLGAGEKSTAPRQDLETYRSDILLVREGTVVQTAGYDVANRRVPVFTRSGSYKGFARVANDLDKNGFVSLRSGCVLRDGDYVRFARVTKPAATPTGWNTHRQN